MRYYVGRHPLDNVALGNGRTLVLLQQYMLREYRSEEGRRRDFTGLEMRMYSGRKPIDRISGICYPGYDRDSNLLGATGIYTSIIDRDQRIWYDFYETSDTDNTYEKTAGYLSVDNTRFIDGTGIYEVISHKTSIVLRTTTWVPFQIDAVIRKIEVSSQFQEPREMTVYPQLHLRGSLTAENGVIISQVTNFGEACYLAIGCTDAADFHYGDFHQGRTGGFNGQLPDTEEPSDRANLTFRVERQLIPGTSSPVYLVLGLGRSCEEALDNYHRVTGDPQFTQSSSLAEWNLWLDKGVTLSSSNEELDYQWKKSKSLLRMSIQEDGLYTYIGYLGYQEGVWVRDTCWMALYLNTVGYPDECAIVLRGLTKILKKKEDGNFYFRYNCRTHESNEFTTENDSMGLLLISIGELYQVSGNLKVAEEFWDLIEYCGQWICDHRDETGMILASAGIWEVFRPECGGNFEHTTWDSAVSVYGLEKAVRMAEALGHQDQAQRYKETLQDLASSILRQAVRNGILCRSAESDEVDSAVLPFFTWMPIFGEEIGLLSKTLKAVEATIHDRQLGGIWRGKGLFHDLADGAPWCFPTFWVIQAHLKLSNVERAWDYLQWLFEHTSHCGLMPEHLQGDSQPLGITAASVAEGPFLVTMLQFLDEKTMTTIFPKALKFLKFDSTAKHWARKNASTSRVG